MKSNVDMAKEYMVDTWADVEFLVCRSDIRVPGLGTELVRRAVVIMEERGVKVGQTRTRFHRCQLLSPRL